MAKGKAKGDILRKIAVADCIPTVNNPRTVNVESEKFKSLLESVRHQGVQIPIHVRPHPEQPGDFEVLAGARRLTAAQMICEQHAGRKTIPAIVHPGMSDEEAFNLTVVENCDREDLTVMEEHRQATLLMEHYKQDIKAVMAAIGRSEKWVRLRLKLADLIESLQERMRDQVYPSWGIGHWALIARLPAERQKKLAEDHWRLQNDMSVSDLENDINEDLHLLTAAPFNIADGTLVKKAGACPDCPKRSACQGVLFHDDCSPEALKKDDKCLDPDCWDRKVKATDKRKVEKALEKNPDAPRISSKYRDKKGVFARYQYHPAEKDDPKAVAAVCVDGEDAGEIVHVKLTSKTPAGDSRSNQADPYNSPKEQLKRAEDDLRKKRDDWVKRQIVKDLRAKLKAGDISHEDAALLALIFGFQRDRCTPARMKKLVAMKTGIFNQVVKSALSGLSGYELWYFQSNLIKPICAHFGIDLKALRKQAQEKHKPSKDLLKLREEVKGKKVAKKQ